MVLLTSSVSLFLHPLIKTTVLLRLFGLFRDKIGHKRPLWFLVISFIMFIFWLCAFLTKVLGFYSPVFCVSTHMPSMAGVGRIISESRQQHIIGQLSSIVGPRHAALFFRFMGRRALPSAKNGLFLRLFHWKGPILHGGHNLVWAKHSGHQKCWHLCFKMKDFSWPKLVIDDQCVKRQSRF